RDAPPPATFPLEGAISRFTDWEAKFAGESGAVRIVVQEPGDTLALPDSVPAGVEVVYRPVEGSDTASAGAGATTRPSAPGIWNVLVRARDAIRPVPNLSVINLVPATEVRGGRIGSYRIGTW